MYSSGGGQVRISQHYEGTPRSGGGVHLSAGITQVYAVGRLTTFKGSRHHPFGPQCTAPRSGAQEATAYISEIPATI